MIALIITLTLILSVFYCITFVKVFNTPENPYRVLAAIPLALVSTIASLFVIGLIMSLIK